MESTTTRRRLLETIHGVGVAIVITKTGAAEHGVETSNTEVRPMSNQIEPQRTGEFVVEFDDDRVSGWKTVRIPPVSIQEGNYRDGNETDAEAEWKYIESLGDLEMERVVGPDDTVLLDWQREMWEGGDAEKDVSVTLMNRLGEPIARWELLDALPMVYDPPDFDASTERETVTEEIEITFDRMIRTVP